MTPGLRKLVLTAHVTTSVGWLGAVAGFLALGVVGLTDQDPRIVRAVYLVMEPAAGLVLVPLSVASLLSGLIQSLGGAWGLFRHYWVLVKFLITVVSALILFGFTQTLGSLGDLAADATLSMYELRNLNQSPALHSGGGLLAIFVATILAVYKPWGLTPFGRRMRDARVRLDDGPTTSLPWRLYVLLGIIGLVLLFLVLHLIGGGPSGH